MVWSRMSPWVEESTTLSPSPLMWSRPLMGCRLQPFISFSASSHTPIPRDSNTYHVVFCNLLGEAVAVPTNVSDPHLLLCGSALGGGGGGSEHPVLDLTSTQPRYLTSKLQVFVFTLASSSCHEVLKIKRFGV